MGKTISFSCSLSEKAEPRRVSLESSIMGIGKKSPSGKLNNLIIEAQNVLPNLNANQPQGVGRKLYEDKIINNCSRFCLEIAVTSVY